MVRDLSLQLISMQTLIKEKDAATPPLLFQKITRGVSNKKIHFKNLEHLLIEVISAQIIFVK